MSRAETVLKNDALGALGGEVVRVDVVLSGEMETALDRFDEHLYKVHLVSKGTMLQFEVIHRRDQDIWVLLAKVFEGLLPEA